jgi:hypothetical protein
MLLARKIVVICEWVLISFFAIMFIFFAIDLADAWNAQGCWDRPTTSHCYPWGGEGPVADAGWSYATKRNYLASSIYTLAVMAIALGSMFLLRPGLRILALLAALAVLNAGLRLLPLVI